jgi:Tol biopolymer transport system component
MDRRHAHMRTSIVRIVTALSLVATACSSDSSSESISPTSSTGSSASAAPTTSTSQPTATDKSTSSVAPAPKPGEPWLAFKWGSLDGDDGLWLSRIDGSDRHQLVADLPGGQAHPDWSPDGNQIVFVEKNPTESIWVVNADGSDPHEIVPAGEGCCGMDHPSWSPDGDSISFMHWVGPEESITSQIEVYRITDGSLRVAATSPLPDVLDYPRWSPDGTTFAVEVGRLTPDASGYKGGGIGLISTDTGKLTMLTDFTNFGAYPDWRPDGKALVFDTNGLSFYESVPQGLATNIHTINIDGTGLTQLTHNEPGGERATEPFWRADGTIGYLETDANMSTNRYVKYVSAVGEPLADPTTPIQATHPRIRPHT